ncbi:MAG: hypothetical protein H6592_03645 [Flavobacteriales bacterium]|nr:hypothetical protein [Flavobacteriales bacterium]
MPVACCISRCDDGTGGNNDLQGTQASGIDLKSGSASGTTGTSITEAVQVRDGRAEDGSTRGTVVTIRLRVQLMSEHDAAGDRG